VTARACALLLFHYRCSLVACLLPHNLPSVDRLHTKKWKKRNCSLERIISSHWEIIEVELACTSPYCVRKKYDLSFSKNVRPDSSLASFLAAVSHHDCTKTHLTQLPNFDNIGLRTHACVRHVPSVLNSCTLSLEFNAVKRYYGF
jgi:hypothetical protein